MNTPSPNQLHRVGVFALSAILLAMTWGFAGVAKLTSGGVPSWFSEQFGKTILASFPGLTASYYSIALLETLAALAALGSILRGEFVRNVAPLFLHASILLSLALFVQLSFGKQLLSDYDGTHDLYMYFAGTLVMLIVVRSLDATRAQTRPEAAR
ncbi:MAG: hypothetical protein SFZ23_09060 [Planctomycetota bacterium]|nr:hypothetical protein [Planctomycetota bacterium]